jgi:cytochrome P450
MNCPHGHTSTSPGRTTTPRSHAAIPTASVAETLSIVSSVIAPTAAKGVIVRRRGVLSIADALDFDARAVRAMQRLRDHHGRGPVMLRIPLRHQAVVLHPCDVRDILEQTPEPFATATMEKRGALAHFEPKGALISHGADRAERRRFNEDVLEHERQMHHLAEHFARIVEREARNLLGEIPHRGVLSWNHFAEYWFRIVRQVVFGPSARDDHELREMIDTLRAHGNWAHLSPRRTELREKLLDRIRHYIDRAEDGSLAAVIAQYPENERTAPEHQVPQWLFAFDPAGMTTFRALALLAAHPEYSQRAREESTQRDKEHEPLPTIRAAALEALRLWPTTPLVLRETTRDVEWETGIIPAKTSIIIFAPFFHRDEQRLAYADRFAPEIWMEDGQNAINDRGREMGPQDWPLIPFSRGPGICPGRNIVLLTSSAFIATVLPERTFRLAQPSRLDPNRPLPATLNHFSLRFEVE